jgi:eukaryotic-like serine/threonine-protein kinase
MRRLLRVLWMALLLMIVALTSALVAMRLAIHGREVQVPDVRGKTPAEARRLTDGGGLNSQIERQYYSPTVPAGRVLSQMPAPGAIVRRGWDVRMALSLGPQRIAIPEVIGQSQRAATITLEQRAIDLGSTASAEIPGMTAGQVIGQDPPPNATDASAPRISLLIAQDAAPEGYVVPSFVGQPIGSVTNILKDSGFSVGRVTMVQVTQLSPPANGTPGPAAPAPTLGQAGSAQSNAVPPTGGPSSPVTSNAPTPASIVVAQDPIAGQKILAGSAINFVVR